LRQGRRHTFGKTHGADDASLVGAEPEGAHRGQGLGWKSNQVRVGTRCITSGLEVTWTTTPTRWSTDFFKNLFGYEWELTKSPAGAHQWQPKNGAGAGTVPDAHDPAKRRAPTMLTTDLALRADPAYEKISRRFHERPDQFADAFARAWFKLTHRDMGPLVRYLGPLVPKEQLPYKDPIRRESSADPGGIAALKRSCSPSGLSVAELVSRLGHRRRHSRLRQARRCERCAIRLAPQKDWG
jgi:catalase-peroxidase